MDNWEEIEFSNVLVDESISYGIVQPGPDVRINSIPIIRVKDIKDGIINTSDVRHVSADVEKKYNRTRLEGGELLITVVGSVGETAIVPPMLKGWNVARAVSVARIKESYDKNFVKYLFATPDAKFQMYGNTNDTVQPTLNLKELKSLTFTYPPLPEQKAIAEVLSSLDDKIDLLHRQNKTLEAMAETLFRQWFVEEADDDWGDGKISDIANHSKISVKPQSNQHLLFNHYSIPSFDDNKKPVKEYGINIKSNKYQVLKNSVLFSKLNPHKDKRLWLIQNDPIDETHICSTEFQVVEPFEKENLYFIYGWLSLNDNYREIASGVGGTSGSHQRISPDIIFDFLCPLVPSLYVEKYNSVAQPIFQKQSKNLIQIRSLTNLRDTLLPKLMSGEVRVKMN